MSASQHNLAVTAAGARVLDVGDIILSEITPCYQGQFAQICRTTVIGDTTPLLHEKYAVLQQAMRCGQAAAVPGASVRAVTQSMDDCFRAAGYGDYCRPPYMRVRGHGLGITSDAPGDLTVDSDARLEDGMVFVMHPNQYLPETGYLMCGEPVVITPAGAKALSAAHRHARQHSGLMRDAHRSSLHHDRRLRLRAGSRPARRIPDSPARAATASWTPRAASAMLVYGDAREHSDLAYFTNFIPRHRWALALLPRQGEPRLLVSMSSRDMPAQRLMTWIPDVLSAWTWESVFDPWLAGLGCGCGRGYRHACGST